MIKAAFIGAGNRAIAHMAALTRISDVEIVAIAELDENRALASQAKANERRADGSDPINVRVFNDYRAMVDTADIDCVYLCLPPFVHGQLDHDVIDYGLPVLFEKPVAVEMSIANEIAAHVAEKGIINAAGYQKRYSSAVQDAKALLTNQTIAMAIAIRLSGLPGQPWWRVQSQSGGMLVEQHTHAVDLMRYVCGEIETVYAVGGTQLLNDTPNLDIFDVNACTVRFENGAPGIIGNSCAAPAGASIFPPHLVHVVSNEMVVSVNDAKTTIRRNGQEDIEELLPEENDNYVMNRTFIEAVRSGDQTGILCNYADAARTFAVTIACQRSAEQGHPITMAAFTG